MFVIQMQPISMLTFQLKGKHKAHMMGWDLFCEKGPHDTKLVLSWALTSVANPSGFSSLLR